VVIAEITKNRCCFIGYGIGGFGLGAGIGGARPGSGIGGGGLGSGIGGSGLGSTTNIEQSTTTTSYSRT
jgi:hypothetical protein